MKPKPPHHIELTDFDHWLGVNSSGTPYRFKTRPFYMFDTGRFLGFGPTREWIEGERLAKHTDLIPSGLYGVKGGELVFVMQHGWPYGDSQDPVMPCQGPSALHPNPVQNWLDKITAWLFDFS